MNIVTCYDLFFNVDNMKLSISAHILCNLPSVTDVLLSLRLNDFVQCRRGLCFQMLVCYKLSNYVLLTSIKTKLINIVMHGRFSELYVRFICWVHGFFITAFKFVGSCHSTCFFQYKA